MSALVLTLDQFHRPFPVDCPDWFVFESDHLECTIDVHRDGGYFARVYGCDSCRADYNIAGYGESPQECLDWINQEIPTVLRRIRQKLLDAYQYAEQNLSDFDQQFPTRR